MKLRNSTSHVLLAYQTSYAIMLAQNIRINYKWFVQHRIYHPMIWNENMSIFWCWPMTWLDLFADKRKSWDGLAWKQKGIKTNNKQQHIEIITIHHVEEEKYSVCECWLWIDRRAHRPGSGTTVARKMSKINILFVIESHQTIIAMVCHSQHISKQKECEKKTTTSYTPHWCCPLFVFFILVKNILFEKLFVFICYFQSGDFSSFFAVLLAAVVVAGVCVCAVLCEKSLQFSLSSNRYATRNAVLRAFWNRFRCGAPFCVIFMYQKNILAFFSFL